jgi:methyltransferase (TIGR00027 family)
VTAHSHAGSALVPSVGRTALMTAAARATESRRPDRLFTDPWAAALLDAYRRADADGLAFTGRDDSSELWELYDTYFPGRTPFFDDEVLRAVATGTRQVVILAAGLDARAGRLDLPPDVVVHEVDSAPVLEFKARALADAGLDVARRVPVAADLAGDWSTALLTAGFAPARPAVWLVEGLLFYLTAAAADRLITTIRALAAPGSRLAVEYFDRNPVAADIVEKDARDAAHLDAVVGLFDDGPSSPPAEWFAAHGFALDRLTDVATEIRAQGRPVPRMLDHDRSDAVTIHLAAGGVR